MFAIVGRTPHFAKKTMLKNFTPVLNPQKILAAIPTDMCKFFEQYRQGQLVLRIYRNSTPHNVWLETANEKRDMVYHWDGRDRPPQAFFVFARQLPSSGPKVTYGGWMRGSDAGLLVNDAWVFDQALYDTCVARWDQAVICAKSFNDLTGTRLPDVWSLSSAASGLARRLKRQGCEAMDSPCMGPAVEELASRGFASVTPEGYCYATDALKKQVIPREYKYMQRLTAAC